MKRVAAILSDFDGTLCPTSDLRSGYNDSNMMSKPLEDVLVEISLTIPISIVTSKDFDFIYPKTKKFAKILSCILGLETFVMDKNEQISQDKYFLNKDNEVDIDTTAGILKDNYLFFEYEMAEINSAVLTETAAYLEKKYGEVGIEKKFLKGKNNLLGGITVNWRHRADWTGCKRMYEGIVRESLSIALENSKQRNENSISKEKFDYYTSHLFIQEYSTHPFVDIYITKVNKGNAFDIVVSNLSQFSDIKGQVIYLGDSENDNPAFQKSDISIGISSDDRLRPNLDCKYNIKFENLPAVLKRLVDNNYIFSESLLTF
ncbi:MAG: HAD hydrolase family protein [Candidatus Nitrosocosmicus sp.]|uniref:HAD hydrolase family protein n=1 Tax=Candidatus Nitrosocosmicus agrestis TaxID=2563600 RepID=UPI00122E9571|nr:HAD hydrolase family protein [Candidatus Nitrosocosmicus sp. SS]KAA2281607.1 HAD hydrolase family protein [Candidatus Nitrosocosmicus sp. SS]KAF0869809.1 hypothetical protein E5N71_03400 [Candidatus Nitrosocosmicus sp. SS]